MPSLNLNLNYFDHMKTIRLVARLGPGAAELPIRLWAWVGNHQPESGRLSLLENELESICHWWGEKGAMVTAFIETGFLKKIDEKNEMYEINDWLEHSGHLAVFHKRAKKAARKRWGLHKKKVDASSNASSSNKQCSSRAVHSRAVPYQHTPIAAFESLWNLYPRKLGKDAALKSFKAQVKNGVDLGNIQKALTHFTADIRKKGTTEEYIPHGSTWFNNRWHDWISLSGQQVPPPDAPPAILPESRINQLADPEARAAAQRLRDEKLKESHA